MHSARPGGALANRPPYRDAHRLDSDPASRAQTYLGVAVQRVVWGSYTGMSLKSLYQNLNGTLYEVATGGITGAWRIPPELA